MGSLVGHVAPGIGFFIIGLWHLFNHIKLHILNPKSYSSSPWFPTSRVKYLELYLIIMGSFMSIAMELFIGPNRHQPLDSDGTIPSNHLHNFEHSNISLTFLIYAFFAIVLDKLAPPTQYELTNFVGSVAFGHQLLLFHLHSSDHMGVEGQYHWLLQIVIFVTLCTTLLGISHPQNFLNSFVRSTSIVFQGVWFIVTGYMLWTPSLIPKGCFLHLEDGHEVVRCHDHVSLERAKSLVNIEFSWYLLGVTIFAVTFYLLMIKLYHEKVQYHNLTQFVIQEDEEDEEQDHNDMEAQNLNNNKIEAIKNFLQVGKSFIPMDTER